MIGTKKLLSILPVVTFLLCSPSHSDSIFDHAVLKVPFEVREKYPWSQTIESQDEWELFYRTNAAVYVGPNSELLSAPAIDFGQYTELRESTLRTARAWAMRQEAMSLWDYKSRGWAQKGWSSWLGWVQRCRLEPMKKVGQTIKRHLWGILNAVVLKSHNGHSESMNSRIQRIKRKACGFRNRERFRNAIYFHCGGLDLYPQAISA